MIENLRFPVTPKQVDSKSSLQVSSSLAIQSEKIFNDLRRGQNHADDEGFDDHQNQICVSSEIANSLNLIHPGANEPILPKQFPIYKAQSIHKPVICDARMAEYLTASQPIIDEKKYTTPKSKGSRSKRSFDSADTPSDDYNSRTGLKLYSSIICERFKTIQSASAAELANLVVENLKGMKILVRFFCRRCMSLNFLKD
jgi:hypothetical protein